MTMLYVGSNDDKKLIYKHKVENIYLCNYCNVSHAEMIFSNSGYFRQFRRMINNENSLTKLGYVRFVL